MPVTPRGQEVARATEHTLIRVAEELSNVVARLGSTLTVSTVMPSDYPDNNAHTLLNDIILRLANILTELQQTPDLTPVQVNGTVTVSDGGQNLTVDGEVSVNNFPATQAVSGTVAVNNHPTSMALPDAQVTALKTVTVDNLGVEELTERMLARAPAEGYRIWFDTADANHIFVMEAPLASTEGSLNFRGIRIPLVGGTPVGKVEAIENIAWADRASAGGWS